MDAAVEVDAMARAIVVEISFVVLTTVDHDGTTRTSPVDHSAHDYTRPAESG
jgi:hypothetical protein